MTKNGGHVVIGKPLFVTFLFLLVATGALMIATLSRTAATTAAAPFPCTCSGSCASTPPQLNSILHYATNRAVPQQSRAEIRVTFDVLNSLSPCNFLVFGLGHDSLMWSAFNPGGATLFLEEDVRWLHRVLKDAPSLLAHAVRYTTRLADANALLASYRGEPRCLPPRVHLRGNTRCKLALSRLPAEVYEKEWDVIMIDGPRGYFAEAPGRMAAIFSAAVMARARVRPGVTHVILHDVNRKVEKTFAKEFLCEKFRVKAVGRLWHFQIPAAPNGTVGGGGQAFC